MLSFIIDPTNNDLTSKVIHNFVVAWHYHTVVVDYFYSPTLFIVWLLTPSCCAVIASIYCHGLRSIM